jgi:hypothetical protein
MFQVLVLICAAGMAPADCQRDTAIDVIRGPVAANEITCGLHGQAYVAETALGRDLEGAYVKIQCLRRKAEIATPAPTPEPHDGQLYSSTVTPPPLP